MTSKKKFLLPPNLPQLKADWTWKALGELVQADRGICYGIVQPGKHDENGIPMVNSGDVIKNVSGNQIEFKVAKSLHGKFKRSTLRGGEILLTLVGANFGKVAIAPKDYEGFNCSRAVGVIPIDADVDAEYIAIALGSSLVRYYLDVWVNTTAQPTFNLSDVANLPIAWPRKATRELIVSNIGSLSTKISLNIQTNQTLEQMAQAIFKSWFVDFDPVKAKMNGELPVGMDVGTALLFPEKLDSEIGLPDGWRLSEIDDEVTVVGGGTPSKKNDDFWVDGDIHWTSPKDLSGVQDKVLLDTASKVTEAGLKKVSSGLLPVDTVLLSSRAPVGYLALTKVPMAINQGYIAMKCEKQLPPEFVLQWCVHRMDEIKQRASGSTFAEINKKSFKPISIVVPSEDLLSAYQKLVKPLYDVITSNVHQIKLLSDLRDTLLPKLLSGEIELKG